MKVNELNVQGGKEVDPNLPLDGLISIIYRSQYVIVNKDANELNITCRQISCLRLVSAYPKITQEEIANTFQVDKGTVARTIRKLEDEEFLYRVQDPENRRKYQIFLTEKGKNIIPKIKVIEDNWEEMVCKGLNKDEISKLMELLYLIAENSLEILHNK
ncbi:MAG TPA: MarR family transcriptional regulator [Methanobacterium sp.]|nr:MarR family transcriptional regulator [Methanobacterium sp.]